MTSPTPPRARHTLTTRTHHGETVEDHLEWLRDKTNPEVIAHLTAENDYAEAVAAHLAPLRERLFAEIKGHTRETDISVPVRHGDWWHITRTTEGLQYPAWCRAPYVPGVPRPVVEPGSTVPGEQVLVDGNALAEGREFFDLGALEITSDGTRMAYLTDYAGDERYQVVVVDLDTGDVVDDAVTDVASDLAFSADGEVVFYTRHDAAWRPYQVWRHVVGTDPASDVLLVEEPDERWTVSVGISRDERWVIVAMGSTTSNEYHLLPADDPTGDLMVVARRRPEVEYLAEPAGDLVFVVANHERKDFALYQAVVGQADVEEWLLVWEPPQGTTLASVDAFATHCVASVRQDGATALLVAPRNADGTVGPWHPVPRPTELTVTRLASNPSYDTDTLLISMESLLQPPSTCELRLADQAVTVVKTREVPGFDPSRYREWREWAVAQDGTRVPMSVVAPVGVQRDGTHAGLLYGYGSYEVSIDPTFRESVLSFLDRGVLYAIAHIRGGGELGRSWYEGGKLLTKRNTFTDFVACGRHLVEQGWVAPGRLGARGRSAGGLLMGAVTNIAPDLWRVVDAGVPFVDALTTILDPSLPLTVGEWEEWGDPLHNPEVYAYMRSYSPYENISAQEYPAILATTSLNDTRVFYVEPAKWVARLRQTVTNGPERPIVLRTEMVAGHFGASGRYSVWRQRAWEDAFVLDQLGATELTTTR